MGRMKAYITDLEEGFLDELQDIVEEGISIDEFIARAEEVLPEDLGNYYTDDSFDELVRGIHSDFLYYQ